MVPEWPREFQLEVTHEYSANTEDDYPVLCVPSWLPPTCVPRVVLHPKALSSWSIWREGLCVGG